MAANRQRVLIVDDEPGIQLVLREVLVAEGYETRNASDGRKALEILQEWAPDVILLDLMMPDMDGVEFRRAQEQLPGDISSIPIIVLSGARDLLPRAQAIAAAAAILKPFDLDEIVATIRQVIEDRPA